MCCHSKFHHQLFTLLCNWFIKWRFSPTVSNMVSPYEMQTNPHTKLWSQQWHWLILILCLRLPFDWRQPSTYLIAFLLQFASIFCIVQSCTCNLSLLFGSCQVLISFTRDLLEQLNILSEIIHRERNRMELNVKLSEFIQFHSTAKELSEFPFVW